MKHLYAEALGILLLTVMATGAQAQCAPGIPSAGNPGCIPPTVANSPYYQGDANVPPPTSNAPKVIWRDSWGAIAMDGNTAQSGTVTGLPSKSEAIKAALDQCRANGGPACEVRLTYYNQCAAVAQRPSGGPISVARAEFQEQAEKMAVSACGGPGTCKAVYAACSLPERVQ